MLRLATQRHPDCKLRELVALVCGDGLAGYMASGGAVDGGGLGDGGAGGKDGGWGSGGVKGSDVWREVVERGGVGFMSMGRGVWG